MSKYSTEVRFICEMYSGLTESTGSSSIENVIANAIPKVFDFNFPIFDEAYRNVLQTKILRHYYTKEIGAETVGLWKHWLNTRLNEIMPYYNQLYKSTLLEFNPLYNVDYSTSRSVKTDGEKRDIGETGGRSDIDDTRTANTTAKNYYSDTPQGGVTGLDTLKYLSNATLDDNETTNRNTGYIINTGTNKLDTVTKNTEDYLEQVKGKTSGSSYAKMLQEYRDTFMNIDMLIIDELSDLFMNLW